MISLRDLRNAMMELADTDPASSAAAVARHNSFVNRACSQIALEAPFLFHEQEYRFTAQPEVVPASTADTISRATDPEYGTAVSTPYVFKTNLSVTATNATRWKYDRTWDGRTINIISPTTREVLKSCRIQSVMRFNGFGDPADTDVIWITLDEPFDFALYGDGPFSWRVVSREYYIPADVIEIRNARVSGVDHIWNLEILGQKEAEQRFMVERPDPIYSTSGAPAYIFARGYEKPIRQPNTAPSVALSSADWIGPEPPGQFEYCATLCWGKRTGGYVAPGTPYLLYEGEVVESANNAWVAEYHEKCARNRILEPLWESMPSPVSARIDVGSIGVGSTDLPSSVTIGLPAVGYQYGYSGTFSDGGSNYTPTNFFSGYSWRIYRRRVTADFTNYLFATGKDPAGSDTFQEVNFLQRLDIDDSFYLLAEVPSTILNPSSGHFSAPFFVDNGRFLPDMRVRLERRNGYRVVGLFPEPDRAYDVSCRVVRAPPVLENDTDTPKISEDAGDLIVYKALTYLYEHLRLPQEQARAEAVYQSRLLTLRKRYGDIRPESQISIRHSARAGHQTKRWHQWWRSRDG